MPKNAKILSSEIDYRSLFFSTVKQKTAALTLGISIFLLIALSFSQFTLNKSRTTGVESKEKGRSLISLIPTAKNLKTYTVQSGDQLFLIAEKMYGSALNMADIMKANNITNPDLIEVGQVLVIPSVKPAAPTTGETTDQAASTEKVTIKGEKYTVKQGDTLATIAQQAYGDVNAWKKIADANRISDPINLEVGTTILIPK